MGELRSLTLRIIFESYVLIPITLLGFFFLVDLSTICSFLSSSFLLEVFWFTELNSFYSCLVLIFSHLLLMKFIID
jgi:hypothetical protein